MWTVRSSGDQKRLQWQLFRVGVSHMGLRCFVQSKGCEEEQEEQPAEGRHLRMETRRSRRPSGHQKKSPQLRVRPGRMKERRISQFLCTRNWRVREVMRTLLHRIWAWRSCCNPQAFSTTARSSSSCSLRVGQSTGKSFLARTGTRLAKGLRARSRD